MKLSVVVPAFNEELGIRFFLDALKKCLSELNCEYEVIVVDDGSKDETNSVVRAFEWDELVLVTLVANSGHMAALEAGLLASKGDVVVTMDSDLQHPVECIPEMLRLYFEKDCDVVLGVRRRGDEEKFLRRSFSVFFYKWLSILSHVEIEKNAGDFRLMSRMVVDTITNLPESQKVFRFLVSSFGFKVERIEFSSPHRIYGQSKYNIRGLLRLAVSSLIGFSTAPLTAIFMGGILIFFTSIIYLILVFVQYLRGDIQPGWTSIAVLVVSLSSLQIISIGIVGRYISQILTESRKRPRFIVRNRIDGH